MKLELRFAFLDLRVESGSHPGCAVHGNGIRGGRLEVSAQKLRFDGARIGLQRTDHEMFIDQDGGRNHLRAGQIERIPENRPIELLPLRE